LWVCARAPSSSANLGPGYDVLALAHDAYFDVVCVRPSEETRVVKVTGEWKVPLERNSALAAAEEALKRLGGKGVEIWVHKGVPPGRGLGSSGASAAAAVKAVELLLGKSLSPEEAVMSAAEGERLVSGAAHADNVAASYLGGLVAVTYDPFKVLKFEVAEVELYVVTPWHEVPEGKTGAARSVLPEEVKLRDAVKMVGGAAAVIKALTSGDEDLLAKAIEMDPVVTPARSKLIPCFEEVVKAAKGGGAKGVTISGAGPSLLLVGGGAEEAKAAWERCGVKATYKKVKPARGSSAVPPPSLG